MILGESSTLREIALTVPDRGNAAGLQEVERVECRLGDVAAAAWRHGRQRGAVWEVR